MLARIASVPGNEISVCLCAAWCHRVPCAYCNLIPNSLIFRINMLPAGTGPEAAAEGSYYMFTEVGLLSPIRAHDTVL